MENVYFTFKLSKKKFLRWLIKGKVRKRLRNWISKRVAEELDNVGYNTKNHRILYNEVSVCWSPWSRYAGFKFNVDVHIEVD
jgi:hypothetical protein